MPPGAVAPGLPPRYATDFKCCVHYFCADVGVKINSGKLIYIPICHLHISIFSVIFACLNFLDFLRQAFVIYLCSFPIITKTNRFTNEETFV